MSNSNKKMGVAQLTLLTAMNMMGSGIILLPTKLAQVGTISVISWLITVFGSVCMAYVFAKCGRYSTRMGMGGYAEYAFGKAGNFLASYTYSFSLIFANIAVAVTCVSYGSQVLGINLSPLLVCLCTILVMWLCTAANFFGAKITGFVGSTAVWFVVLPVFGLAIIGWHWFDPQMWISSWNPNHQPFFSAIGASIAMTLWSFLGLETACANSDSVDNPERNVPIAVLTATIAVAIIYISSTNVIAGIVPNKELINSNAPFGLVYASMFGPLAGKIVMGMLVFSCAGSTVGWQFTLARVMESSAQQGYFPKLFTETTQSGAPLKGMLVLVCIQTCFCLLTISPQLFKQFNTLVDLAVVMDIVPYILSMSALPVILKAAKVRGGESDLCVSAAVVGIAFAFYVLYTAGAKSVFYASFAVFFGWVLWGWLAPKFVEPNDKPLS